MTWNWMSFCFGCIAAWLFSAVLLALLPLAGWIHARCTRHRDARTAPGVPPAVVAQDLATRQQERDAHCIKRLIEDTRTHDAWGRW